MAIKVRSTNYGLVSLRFRLISGATSGGRLVSQSIFGYFSHVFTADPKFVNMMPIDTSSSIEASESYSIRHGRAKVALFMTISWSYQKIQTQTMASIGRPWSFGSGHETIDNGEHFLARLAIYPAKPFLKSHTVLLIATVLFPKQMIFRDFSTSFEVVL